MLHSHISEMQVGTYKKAHRHAPDVHIYILSGEGYSLLWFDGDKDFRRVDWKHSWVFSPEDMQCNQHINTGTKPVRYIAFTHGSVLSYDRADAQGYAKLDRSVKNGGNQIEYADRDPRIHVMFEQELARKGLTMKMSQATPVSA